MEQYILIASPISQLVAFSAGLLTRRMLDEVMRILIWYFALAFLAEVLASLLASRGINNLWVVHLFTVIEFTFFALVFSLWQPNPLLRRILQFTVPLYAVVGFLAMILLENVRQFNTVSQPVASLILVAASALTLFELGKENFESVFRQPRFWVASAALLYHSSNLVIFSLSNVLLAWDVEVLRGMYTFHLIMNIMANLIYAGGFLCLVRAQRSGGL